MISFTNHALDHLLGSILDADITRSVVRLGTRCTDERVAPFSMEELEKGSNGSRLSHRLRGITYHALKDSEEEMKEFLEAFVGLNVKTESLGTHLRCKHKAHWDGLSNPPWWIKVLFKLQAADSEWYAVKRHGKAEVVDSSLLAYWMRGADLAFLEQAETTKRRRTSNLSALRTQKSQSNPALLEVEVEEHSDEENSASDLDYEFSWQERLALTKRDGPKTSSPFVTDRSVDSWYNANQECRYLSQLDLNDAETFLTLVGETSIPRIPLSDRSLEKLLVAFDIWDMSLRERQKLTEHWSTQVRESLYETYKRRFDTMADSHDCLREAQRAEDEEVRL